MKNSEDTGQPSSPLLGLIKIILDASAAITALAILSVFYLKSVDWFLKDWFGDNEFMSSLAGGAAFVNVTTFYIIIFATLPAVGLLLMSALINKFRKFPAFSGMQAHGKVALITAVLVVVWVVILVLVDR